jgi:hypothetical protein
LTSPIESYNNTIKESFTKRIKHHMKSAVEVFQDVVSYESKQGKEFKNDVRVRKFMRTQAKTIVLKKQLIPTQSENEFLYKHFDVKLGYAKININSKTCTCHKYFDNGICKHLVVACLQVKVSLPGLEQLPKKFIVLRRKKRNQYRDISGDEIDLAIEQERPLVQMPIVESLHQETVEASQAEVLETEI